MQNKVNKKLSIVAEDAVITAEYGRIRERRRQAGLSAGSPERDAIGLALSGGGIRSATFNLGLLQALQSCGLLKYIDYLSTVSGGGYIGGSLTWFMTRRGEDFPFGAERKANLKQPGVIVSWIREHASYLTPGRTLDLWALVSAILRGVLINLLVLTPVFFAVVYYLVALKLPPSLLFSFSNLLFPDYPNNGFILLLNLGILFLLVLGLGYVLYALFSLSSRSFGLRGYVSGLMGQLLRYGVSLAIIGAVPLIYNFLKWAFPELYYEVISSVSIVGVMSVLGGWIGRTLKNENKSWRRILLSLGLSLLIYGLLLWLYHGANTWITPDLATVIYGFALAAIAFGAVANINYVSIHRYYRDRLLGAFMPEPPDFSSFKDADSSLLKDFQQTQAPYHIINSLMMTLNSQNMKLSLRGGDNFIFSPLYCGANSTGYAPTGDYLGGTMDLATAFSISGAAVDPNVGVTRSRPLAFLMTLLNIRIGYWARNPGKPAPLSSRLSRSPNWFFYTLRELLGFDVDETRQYVYLSDGGHFENLGLYELIRRRCRFIIVSDAGEDSDWTFGSLANAIEKVRVDFAVHINIDTRELTPRGSNQISRKPFVIGDIQYADGRHGTLLYLKTCVIGGLPEDVYGYHRAHPRFPNESTKDQFFEEPQFEAYRELGFQLGKQVCKEKSVRLKCKLSPRFG